MPPYCSPQNKCRQREKEMGLKCFRTLSWVGFSLVRKFKINNFLTPANTQPKFKVYNRLMQRLGRQMNVLLAVNVLGQHMFEKLHLKFPSKDQR